MKTTAEKQAAMTNHLLFWCFSVLVGIFISSITMGAYLEGLHQLELDNTTHESGMELDEALSAQQEIDWECQERILGILSEDAGLLRELQDLKLAIRDLRTAIQAESLDDEQ